MGWLNRMPGQTQTAPGLEWRLWKRLPLIGLVGTVLPLLIATLVWWLQGDVEGLAAREQQRWWYMVIGVVVLHWTGVLTTGIGCVIVMIMKGPAFVSDDPYPFTGPQRHSGHTDAPPKDRSSTG